MNQLHDTTTASLIPSAQAERFDALIGETASPVLIDFWAPWCGPCRLVAPVLERLAAEYRGRLRIAKLNVDEAPDLAARYGVRSIPTLVLFQGGQPLRHIVGAQSAEALKGWLAPIL